MTSLRHYLDMLEKKGAVYHINEHLSPEYEIPAFLQKYHHPISFNRVDGFKNRVVGGVCGSRELICEALGIEEIGFHEHLHGALKNPTPCKIDETDDSPVKEVVKESGLTDIPVLTHYEYDQGPYLTSAIVYAKDPGGQGGNVSFHRMDLLDENRLAICIQPGHLARYVEKTRDASREFLDISISIGNHPGVMLAAACGAPEGRSEFDIANTLLGGELILTKCIHVDALAPAGVEIVLEGRIFVNEKELEGPYVCVTGVWKEAKSRPVVRIMGIMHRKDYIYQSLLPASQEHRLLEGMPNEIKIWKSVREIVPEVRGVNMTLQGSSWLHCIVSCKKKKEGDSKAVLSAMFATLPALKHALVVDTDIDPYDPEEVEWAMSTRFQGDRDLLLIPNAYASRLDPSSDLKRMMGCKVGFDATRPLNEDEGRFIKGVIPKSDRVKGLLDDL